MLLTVIRDLQWRMRRFVIAGVGAAMVFALTLLLAGLSHSFQAEAGRTVDAVGADAWVVKAGVDGPFTTVSVVPGDLAAKVAKEPGVVRADPIVVLHQTLRLGEVKDVNLIGYQDGGLGQPRVARGRLPSAPGEIVVDETLKARIGTRFVLADTPFQVVGTTTGMTVNGGQPMVYVRLAEAQKLFVSGLDIANAVVTRGMPEQVPAGYVLRTRDETRQSLLRPLKGAIDSFNLTLFLLWGVAALVIGSVLYLSALERTGDFAVYKATGWSTRMLGLGLALQATLLSTGAAVLGIVVAQALLPLFPLTFTVPSSARLMLPVVGLAVGLLASAAGLRKGLGVDPALAFGGQG